MMYHSRLALAHALILAALLLALASPLATAQSSPQSSPRASSSGPTQDYLVYVVCESADRVVLLASVQKAFESSTKRESA